MDNNKIDVDQKQLIDLITNEVMHYIEMNRTYSPSNKKSVLVLGDIEKAREIYSDKYEYQNIESYLCDIDIEKYSFIFITKITNAQLCDIALGRDSTPFTCSIQKALLTGKKVYMCISALSYRKYKETAVPKLYDMLEKYAQKLVEFGIVITQDTQIKNVDNYKCDKNDQYDSCEKLITYSTAQNLCKMEKKQVILAKGTIITPLAKDLFLAEKIDIQII